MQNFSLRSFLELLYVGIGKLQYFKTMILFFKILVENETSLGTKGMPSLSGPLLCSFILLLSPADSENFVYGGRGGIFYWEILWRPPLPKSIN